MTRLLRRLALRPVAVIATTFMMLGLALVTTAPAANADVDPKHHGYCNNWRGFTYPMFPGTVLVPSIGAGTTHCVMGQGAQGNGVLALQRALLHCHRLNPGPLDGIYGTQTRNAVIAFQRGNGLADDGVYGPQTRDAMYFAAYNGGTFTNNCARDNWP